VSIIIGIDPGSRVTGYGVITSIQNKHQYVASGCIRVEKQPLPMRLKTIFENLLVVIDEHKPDEFAIENVFMSKNAGSALKLGQARGAAICAGVYRDLPVGEYTPRQVKQSVVGYGGADKSQVQHMVKTLLNIQGNMAEDASDALAVALCHSHVGQTQNKLYAETTNHYRKGRMS
jgi:crossover junction endodeoxyribonuclease RuvC